MAEKEDPKVESNEEVAEESTEQPVVESEVPEQLEEAEQETEEEAEPEEEVSEEPKISRRAELRIQKLLQQNAQLRQQPQAPKATGLDYSTALEADPEVIKQLEADRNAATQTSFQQGLQQAQAMKWETMLNIDAPRIESQYPQLDKKAAEFNPAVADAVNQMYLSTVGYNPGDPNQGVAPSVQNPNLRYSDYVESIMELVESAAGEKVARTSKNIAKQAATTGLRPDGSQAKRLNLNKAPEQMTDEELDAVLQQTGL